MTKIPNKTIILNNDNSIPTLGLGTWQLTGKELETALTEALEIGYRHIDTADIYGNHSEIGKILKKTGYNKEPLRDSLFLTTKLWFENLAPVDIYDCVERFLTELQVKYLDLLLIHWPNSNMDLKSSLETMQKLQNQGLVRSIGVSNFTINHLKDVIQTGINIQVNQVEIHPTLQQLELIEFCNGHKIKVEAYSPIGRGKDLKLDEIIKIAKKHSATPAQICLSYLMSLGLVVIPKSSNPKRLKENLASLDITLDNSDINILKSLDITNRLIDPNFASFDY